MRSLDATQLAAVALTAKTVKWVFTITDKNAVVYKYSTGAITGVSNDIVLTYFSGITLNRNMAENKIITPSEVYFFISNSGSTLLFSDFKGGSVLIDLYINNGTSDVKIASWLFRIKTAQPGYQNLKITAEDFLQTYLEGYYPNTRYPQDIFPSNRTHSNKALCVPIPFGTAYVPLRDVFITDSGYLLLGPSSYTYTISKIRSPRDTGSKIEWDSGSYTFTQSTQTASDSTSWRAFKAIIADSNSDGAADTHGCWMSAGGPTQDPPVRFTRSDTAAMTNPADVISFVLQDMGIPSGNIDTSVSFAAAHTIYDGLGLTFNGAFWYKQKRENVLAQLLTMCHSCLQVGEKIELHVLSKTSRKTITAADIIRTSDQGEGSFVYSDIVNTDLSDSGYVAFQPAGEAQDELIKTVVGINGVATVLSDTVVECPFVQDSQDVKRIGILHFQRLLGKESQVTFTTKGTCLALQPDDVISLNDGNYGGSYSVLVDSVKINKDLSMDFVCSKYKVDFDDWEDLTPTELTIPSETTVASWTPVMSGPDSVASIGSGNNWLTGRLKIGSGSNYILIEPGDPIRISLYSGSVEQVRFGNLNGFLGFVANLFGFAGGNETNYAKIDATTGTVAISGALTTGTGSSLNGQYLTALSVVAASIANATITSTQIANATITGSNIANATITSAQISNTAGITGTQIASATIAAANLVNATITASQIANLTITASQIANLTITGAKVANNALGSGKLRLPLFIVTSGTFTNNSPSSGYVAWTGVTIDYNGTTYSISANNTNAKYIYWAAGASVLTAGASPPLASAGFLIGINASGIYSSVWDMPQINGAQIMNGSVSGTQIANNSIAASNIANATITSAQIAAATIAASNIANLTITASQIANLTITANQINSNAITTAKVLDDNITRRWCDYASASVAEATLTTLCSLTFTPDGSDLLVICSGLWVAQEFNNLTDSIHCNLSLYNGASLVAYGNITGLNGYAAVSIPFICTDGVESPHFFQYLIESPGTSSITLYLKGYWNTVYGALNNTNVGVYGATLTVLELKK